MQASDLGSSFPQLSSTTDSLCDLERDIPSPVALWSSEDTGEGGDEAISVPPAEVIHYRALRRGQQK